MVVTDEPVRFAALEHEDEGCGWIAVNESQLRQSTGWWPRRRSWDVEATRVRLHMAGGSTVDDLYLTDAEDRAELAQNMFTYRGIVYVVRWLAGPEELGVRAVFNDWP